MNQLTYTTIRKLPEIKANATDLRQAELSFEFWKHMYADAGSQSVIAWKMYQDAIDNDDDRKTINSLFETATLYDEICRGAWAELETAKKNLLALHN